MFHVKSSKLLIASNPHFLRGMFWTRSMTLRSKWYIKLSTASDKCGGMHSTLSTLGGLSGMLLSTAEGRAYVGGLASTDMI